MIALAALAGLDPTRLLRVRPGVERDVLTEIAEEMIEQHREQRREQAVWIINTLSDAFSKSKSRGGSASKPRTARGRRR